MPKQTHKQKAKQERKAETVEEIPQVRSKEEVKAETEALLDEIDEILEVNAEEFVKSYIQKGGQ